MKADNHRPGGTASMAFTAHPVLVAWVLNRIIKPGYCVVIRSYLGPAVDVIRLAAHPVEAVTSVTVST